MSGFRYGRFTNGSDPLASAPDVAAGVDELARRVMQGQTLPEALRDLLRDGLEGRRGLEDLARQIRQRRKELSRSGQMDGLLKDLRELLDEALAAERSDLFPDPSDDARFREAVLDNVPDDVGRAVRELTTYAWRSDETRAACDELKDHPHR